MTQICTNNSTWPNFDFNSLPLSQAARQQLKTHYRTLRQGPGPAAKSQLARLLRRYAFDPANATYIPLSDRVDIPGKLPFALDRLTAWSVADSAPLPITFFSNPLLIPDGYGEPKFDPHGAEAPRTRLTSVGLLVATIEFDPNSVDEFEEILACTRGKSGKVANSPFGRVDRALRQYRDYRGFSIASSGGRSLHFHFVVSTDHIATLEGLSDPTTRRLRAHETAALLHNAHAKIWDCLADVFTDALKPSLPPDRKMRNATQWRRVGGGIRVLEKSIAWLGLAPGMAMPQLIMAENIRERAPRDAHGHLIAPDFSLTMKVRPRPQAKAPAMPTVGEDVIRLLQELCQDEWGQEYPCPVAVEHQGDGFVIRFHNHADDRNPSTVCIGSLRKLLLAGSHALTGEFYLPDGMTADECVRHAQARCGLLPPAQYRVPDRPLPSGFEPARPVATFEQLKQERGTTRDWLSEHTVQPLRGLLSPNVQGVEAADKLRTSLPEVIRRLREHKRNYLLLGPEGLAKSSVHFAAMAEQALSDAMEHNPKYQSFFAFACRSARQAEDKAQEFRKRTGKHAVVIAPLRRVYEAICTDEGVAPLTFALGLGLPRDLSVIQDQQPNVFDRLQEYRDSLFTTETRSTFDASRTVLFMTHNMARFWHRSRTTRTWLHPYWHPSLPRIEADELRSQFTLSEIVYDELEIDEFVHVLSEPLYEAIKHHQEKRKDWRDISKHQRLDMFNRDQALRTVASEVDFEGFDQLMRLDLSKLETISVNFGAIPFGYDNKEDGLYTGLHGSRFYVGQQDWFASSARWAFLTTERLSSTVVAEAHKREGRPLEWLEVPWVPGIHPVAVPVAIDPRAAADRPGRPKVSALAQEILDANANAVVITDGVKACDRVITHQSAKGRNDLADRDVYIILTNLAPAHFQTLNVLGQWCGAPNAVDLHYSDLISQAVGRNRGFRSSEKPTRTVVISTSRLHQKVLSTLNSPSSRFHLYVDGQRHW